MEGEVLIFLACAPSCRVLWSKLLETHNCNSVYFSIQFKLKQWLSSKWGKNLKRNSKMCFSLLKKRGKTTYGTFPNVFAKLLKMLRFSFNKVSAYLHIRNCELHQFKWIVKSFSLQLFMYKRLSLLEVSESSRLMLKAGMDGWKHFHEFPSNLSLSSVREWQHFSCHVKASQTYNRLQTFSLIHSDWIYFDVIWRNVSGT